MKKYIVISIIAVVALLPFAAWADTGGSAEATLTFDSVINTIVTDDWGNTTLTQPDINAVAGGGASVPIDWGLASHTPEITVKVQALTDWAVYGSYSSSEAATGFTDSAHVIYLYEESSTLTTPGNFANYLVYSEITTPTDYSGDGTGLTNLAFSGSNNLAAGGDTNTYDVKWDPTQFTGDWGVSDTVDFTIYFVVADSST